MKNLKWGKESGDHTASKWTLWDRNPRGCPFNQDTVPASDCRNSFEDFTGEMRRLLMGAVHVLSSLKQRWMTLSSLWNKNLAHQKYSPSTLCTVTITLWDNLLVIFCICENSQRMELGFQPRSAPLQRDSPFLATVLFYLPGTVLLVLEAWLPALALDLLFHQPRKGWVILF